MTLFRCTAKLQARLRSAVRFVDSPAVQPVPFGEWFCNILTIDHRQCLLFTETTTLYAVLLFGVRKPEFESIGDVFRENLFGSLVAEGFPARDVERIVPLGPDLFSKTNSRSVLGSMNDYAFHVRYFVSRAGGLAASNPREVEHLLNDMPMQAIRSDPLRRVRELLLI